jgi:excisionase family DNA binding protein
MAKKGWARRGRGLGEQLSHNGHPITGTGLIQTIFPRRPNMPEIENPAPGSAAQIAPELLTKFQVAELLGISTRSVDNMMKQRRISFVRLSARMVRFPRREILQHVHEHLTIHARGSERDV